MRLYGERDGGEQEQKFQSTHPLRGATGIAADETNRIENFNPRTPCGVRLEYSIEPYYKDLISIHAPLAGCDISENSTMFRTIKFQSTHPLRGATLIGVWGDWYKGFQSTHPLRGATVSD